YPVERVSAGLDEDIFENEGQSIRVTVVNRGQARALIYFGGNAEDVDYNVEPFAEIFPAYTVYLVKYRGYGGSSGKPSEQAFYADALHIADTLAQKHSAISVIGRSLGSAVATYLAANRPVDKLVLVTPFDSAMSVAKSMWPLYPVALLLKEEYNSLARVGQIQAETLLIAAEADEVIDMALSKRLADAFGSQASFYVVAGAGHNDLSLFPEYHQLLKQFFQDGVSGESQEEEEKSM